MMKLLRLQAKVEAKDKVQDDLVQLPGWKIVLLGEGVAMQGGIIPGGKLG